MSTPNLEFISTDNLLEEVMKRFDCCIFLGNQARSNGGDIVHKVEGNLLGVLGLFRLGEFYTLMKIDESTEELTKDDD